MINIIEVFKELLIAKKAVTNVAKAPKSGYLTTEWLGIFLTGLSAIYMGLHNLIPPVVSIYIGIGLSVLWLIFRQVLKWKHLSLQAIPGIPDLDTDALLNLLIGKFPKFAPLAEDAKSVIETVVDEIKKDPEVTIPAPAGSTTTVSVTPPAPVADAPIAVPAPSK